MDIHFECERCGQQLVIEEAGTGLTIQCPSCSVDVIVPATNKVSKQPGLQVGCGSMIQSAVQSVAKLVESGAFDKVPGEDKATMGWEWFALHGGHQNCDKCEFYNGQRWTKDYKPVGDGPEFPGKPPLHAECQCALIPVDLEGSPPAATKLDGEFRSQSKLSLETSFGKANTEAFLSGKINCRQLLQQGSWSLSPDALKKLRADKDVQALLKAIK